MRTHAEMPVAPALAASRKSRWPARMDLVLVGRSSSHFTRVARIFALELGVPFAFEPVLDLTVLDPARYAGNPALKVPVLRTPDGPLFGCENLCRALHRHAGSPPGYVMRGELPERVVANAEELTLHAMSNEVFLITAKLAGDVGAAPPELGEKLYEHFAAAVGKVVPVQRGRFRADMKVALLNDGPVTFLLDPPVPA
mgnify:CR=1 FL=1